MYESKESHNLGGVLSIEDNTFSGCSSLEEITIPASVTSIGASAFSDCSSLEEITIPANVTSIGAKAFSNDSILRGITIPSNVKKIGEFAFSGCSSLTSIAIPSSVTDIGVGVFAGCSSVNTITVEGGEYTSKNSSNEQCNAILQKKDSQVILICGCKDTIIPSEVTAIGDYAFFGCTGRLELGIPDSSNLKSIGKYAFANCVGLREITIPSSVESIGEGAFSGCITLVNAKIQGSITIVEKMLFSDCISLVRVEISDCVITIGESAFLNCSRLTYIKSLENVTEIGAYAFSGCSSLKDIILPSCLTKIGVYAFLDCISIEIIEIPNSVVVIGKGAFSNCINLTKVTISKSVMVVGFKVVFSNCVKLTTVTIAEGVTSIEAYAFLDCTELTTIIISDTVTTIGTYAFSNCTGLRTITISSRVTSIGAYAFFNCSSLTSITLLTTVKFIGTNAFLKCENLIIYCYKNSYVYTYIKTTEIKTFYMLIDEFSVRSTGHLFYDYTYKRPVSGSSITLYGNTNSSSGQNQAVLYTKVLPSYIFTINNKGKIKASSGKVIAGVTMTNIKPTLTKNKIVDKEAENIAKVKVKNGVVTVTATGKASGIVFLWVMDTGNLGTYDCVPIRVKMLPKKLQIWDNTGNQIINPQVVIGEDLIINVTGLIDATQKTYDGTYTATVDAKSKPYVSIEQTSENEFCIKNIANNTKDIKIKITFTCDQNGKKVTLSMTLKAP